MNFKFFFFLDLGLQISSFLAMCGSGCLKHVIMLET
jgi:hypothetical protein